MDSNPLIYCDMDGVIVDFIKGYFDLTGRDITGQHLTDSNFWIPINRVGHTFWSNLEWTSDGKQLWGYIKKYNPKILSAPSNRIDSMTGKRDWVKRELNGTKLILKEAHRKKEFANPSSILIDDRHENIEGWINSGGIGIIHLNTNDTIEKLKNLGL